MKYCQEIRGIKVKLSGDYLKIIINEYTFPNTGEYYISHLYEDNETYISYFFPTIIYYCDEEKLDNLIDCIINNGDIDKEFGDYLSYITDITIEIVNSLGDVYSYVDPGLTTGIEFQLKGNQLVHNGNVYFNIDDDFVKRINEGDITISDGTDSIISQIINIFNTYGKKGVKSARY